MQFLSFIFLLLLFTSCKKDNKPTASAVGTIAIDVRNHEATLQLQKEINLDSVIFKFTNDQVYNCNLYKINYALSKESNNLSFVLGNVYYDAGFCVFGNFPATATYKQKDLQLGKYDIVITKNNQKYTGSLTVSNAQYVFDWEHDAVIKIDPKIVNKQ